MKLNSAPKINSLIIIALFSVIFSKTIFAQSTTGLTAIPPRLEIIVKPGEVVTKEIKVRNESATEKVISTSIKDFIVTDDLGTPLQIESTDPSANRWAASSWIQISPTQLKLKAGETKSLILTVIAPDNALIGGHYAMVLHTPQNDISMTQTGAAVQTNVGTLVYITVPGNINENASIKDFSAPRFSEYGPIDFKTIITNLSDIHITPAGAINIYNTLGLQTAQIKLDNTNIFPYTSREFLSTLQRKLMLGRYKAQLNAVYGTTGQLLTATIFFWVIPYKLIALILVITILVIMIIKLKKKTPPTFSETPQVEELEKELEDLKKKYQDKK
jgi:hypothetical protein